jgi:RNA polymerase sigma-70 factor (ECF subfamily)
MPACGLINMTPKELKTQEQKREQTAAMTVAHNSYSVLMNKYAFFKIHDHAIGEDMVQDTFMKTWTYLIKGGKIDIMKAFLYHILNNLIIDQYRKKKTTSLDTLVEKGFDPGVDDSARILDVFDGKAAILMIARLPEKYKRIMRMKYIQFLSIKEISILTGQSKNAVAVQTHRGMAKLRLLYKPAYQLTANQ